MQEEWREIEGYDGYEASNKGRVRSFKNGRWGLTSKPYIMKATKSPKGYLTLYPMVNGKKKTKALHRLVAEAFVKNPHNKPCINHIDANKLNNTPSNLEWCTIIENNGHSMANGLHYALAGEGHPSAILNEQLVLQIRKELKGKPRGIFTILGKKYGVSWCTIKAISDRKTWKHI